MSIRTPLVYLAVAGLCFVLHSAVIILSHGAGSPLWLAVLLSFVVVAATGYVLHGLFTFRQPLGLVASIRYAVAMSTNIPLAFVTTWFWHDWAGLAMPFAAPIASVCMLVANFLLGRRAIAVPNRRMAASS